MRRSARAGRNHHGSDDDGHAVVIETDGRHNGGQRHHRHIDARYRAPFLMSSYNSSRPIRSGGFSSGGDCSGVPVSSGSSRGNVASTGKIPPGCPRHRSSASPTDPSPFRSVPHPTRCEPELLRPSVGSAGVRALCTRSEARGRRHRPSPAIPSPANAAPSELILSMSSRGKPSPYLNLFQHLHIGTAVMPPTTPLR